MAINEIDSYTHSYFSRLVQPGPQKQEKIMINKALYSSKSDEWATPSETFDELNAEFGFTLDPCSTDNNCKCKKHFTRQDDGLSKDWGGDRILQPAIQ